MNRTPNERPTSGARNMQVDRMQFWAIGAAARSHGGEDGDPPSDPPGELRWSRRCAMRVAIDFSLGSVCHGAMTLLSSVPICAPEGAPVGGASCDTRRAQPDRSRRRRILCGAARHSSHPGRPHLEVDERIGLLPWAEARIARLGALARLVDLVAAATLDRVGVRLPPRLEARVATGERRLVAPIRRAHWGAQAEVLAPPRCKARRHGHISNLLRIVRVGVVERTERVKLDFMALIVNRPGSARGVERRSI